MVFKFAAALVLGVLVTGIAQAQFSKPESAVKYRQSAMTLMGNHASRINTQLKADKADLQTIQASAALIEILSKLPFEAFVPGSESAANTNAKPEVFKETAKFKRFTEKFQDEAVKLAATAKAGDLKAIKAQFGAVSQACKACHDDFLAE